MNCKKIFKNDIFVFLLFLVIFYAIFRYVGTFNQGFNIVEDHFLITTNQSLESESFSTVFKQMMRTELEGIQRFRPVWVFYVLATIKLFGVNLLLINIYLVFLCTFTAFMLYKFCSNIKFTYIQSLLFPLVTLIGPATIIYIRPPDAEIIGMLMLSITLFFLSKSIYSQINKIIYSTSFIISLTLTILCKESFMIAVPAIILLYVLTYSFKNNKGIFQTLKENKLILILPSLILLFFLLYLISAVGINHKKGYSGVDINLFSGKVIADFVKTIFNNMIFYVILLGIFIVIISDLKNRKKHSEDHKDSIKNVLLVFLFMLMVIIPQFILYYKTGFFVGRYYFPFLLGFTFLLVYTLKIIFESRNISSFVKYFYLSIILIFLLYQLRTETIPALSQHSEGCKANTEMLYTIADNPNKELLVVMDPAQNFYVVYSLKIILEYLNGQKNYKYDFINMDYVAKLYADSSFSNRVLIESKKTLGNSLIDSTKDNSDIKDILIFWSLDKKFLEKNKIWFNENNYQKKKIGSYTLYSK